MRCYVDYTCGHSYRAWSWLSGVDAPIDWRTFSLKEVNRSPEEARAFDDESSVSVLALALSHAARPHDFRRYHDATFQAFHSSRVAPEDLIRFAGDAGVDLAGGQTAFVEAARTEHDEARERWGIFGTPTMVFDGDRTAFLRFEDVPTEASLLDRIASLARPGGVTLRILEGDVSPAD